MNAPERIVAWVWDLPYPSKVNGSREWDEWDREVFPTEQDCHDYIRADLYDAQAAEIADLRRQLAEARADADLAVAEALRKAEAVMRAHMVSAERCVALEDRAEAAEAEVARLREALTGIKRTADHRRQVTRHGDMHEYYYHTATAALTPKGDTP